MAAPLVPLLILGGLAAYAMASGSKSGGGAVPAPTANPKYDANLPADLEATVDQELMNDTDPNQLLTLANALRAQGYPIAAAALEQRAAELQQPNPPPPPVIQPVTPPAPSPPPSPPAIVPLPVQPPTPAQPSALAPFGDDAVEWQSTWSLPSARTDAASVFAGYGYAPTVVQAIQSALNGWAQQIAFDPNQQSGLWPIAVDGDYGPATAALVAAFQAWVNGSNAVDYAGRGFDLPALPLTLDGIAGADTLAFLGPWEPGSGLPNA